MRAPVSATGRGRAQHLISRFVGCEFLLDRAGARTEYLCRVPAALGRTDWRALAYALVSSHVHWAIKAGERPSSAFVKPLHVGFAQWLNRATRDLGPVFADRHRSIECPADSAATLVAERKGTDLVLSRLRATSGGRGRHLCMPRYRRQVAAGSVQHLISRFARRDFLFDLPGARVAYTCRRRA